MKDFKKDYQSYFESIKPEPKLLEKTRRQPVKKFPIYRLALAMAAFLIVTFVGTQSDNLFVKDLPQPTESKEVTNNSTIFEDFGNKQPDAMKESLVSLTTLQELVSYKTQSKAEASDAAQVERFPHSYLYLTLITSDLDTYYLFTFPAELVDQTTNQLELDDGKQEMRIEQIGCEVWLLIGPKGNLGPIEDVFQQYKNQPDSVITKEMLPKTVKATMDALSQSKKPLPQRDDLGVVYKDEDSVIFKVRYGVTFAGITFPTTIDGLVYELSEYHGQPFLLVGRPEEMTRLKQILGE